MRADITVLQQTYNGQLKVLCRVTGDDCGGTSVDDRFCNMLEEIVGGNVIAEFKRQDPEEWMFLLRGFRGAIEKITTSNTNVIRLRFPIALNEICEELHGKDLNSVMKSSSHVNEISLFNNILRFKADLMIKLFTPTTDSIITLMKKTLSNSSTNGVSNDVSNILMVGGLSECPMLQDAVYKAFPDNQIIIPKETGFSVLCGAVLFGHRPDYIWSELRDEEGIGK
jgi:molecular chaperone DnaK (HSP70)